MPPATPESSTSPTSIHRIGDVYLPSREICTKYISRFFDEIHCIYWVYSPEQFYTLLDRTLEDGGVAASSSWLCSLYSIFAICSTQPVGTDNYGDHKSSADYLSMAKDLGLRVCDEADIGSVQALALLVSWWFIHPVPWFYMYGRLSSIQSLALHSACFSVSSYLILGMAVRTAFSLGLHRNVSPKSQASVERERGRRLWWTIYIFDQELAVQLGHPCAVIDEATRVQTPFSAEQVSELSGKEVKDVT